MKTRRLFTTVDIVVAIIIGTEVVVFQDEKHGDLMTSIQLSKAYKTSADYVRGCIFKRPDRYINGKHFVRADQIFSKDERMVLKITRRTVLWTKYGATMLGIFMSNTKYHRRVSEELIEKAIENGQISLENLPIEQL